jgi:hypothetical protein
MAENNPEKSSRRNFKIKIGAELLEIVTMLEFLMQRKEMYVLMCQSFNKKLREYQEQNLSILPLLNPEYGEGELIVYFPEDLLAPSEAFANAISMNLRDIVYNMVTMYLIEVQKKMAKEDREVIQKIAGTRERLFDLFHSLKVTE